MQNNNGIPPIDENKLMILEEKVKERENELKKIKSQIEIFFHDSENYIQSLSNAIDYALVCSEKKSDLEKQELILCIKETSYQLSRFRILLEIYNSFFFPALIEFQHFTPAKVHSVVSRICSYYMGLANSKRIQISIDANLTKEYSLSLGSSVASAIAMIVDNAINLAPENSDITIFFNKKETRLFVEFKSWEMCQEENGYYSVKHAFGAGIIWNPVDKDVALNLLKKICDHNNIEICFTEGREKKEIDGKPCKSYVVELTFNPTPAIICTN